MWAERSLKLWRCGRHLSSVKDAPWDGGLCPWRGVRAPWGVAIAKEHWKDVGDGREGSGMWNTLCWGFVFPSFPPDSGPAKRALKLPQTVGYERLSTLHQWWAPAFTEPAGFEISLWKAAPNRSHWPVWGAEQGPCGQQCGCVGSQQHLWCHCHCCPLVSVRKLRAEPKQGLHLHLRSEISQCLSRWDFKTGGIQIIPIKGIKKWWHD